ncbi:hypothetical protein ACFL17_06465, partial [Pseudomonadota bacterium]
NVQLNIGGITLTFVLGLLRGPIDRLTANEYSCDRVLQNIADGLEESGETDKVHAGVWKGLRREIQK